MSWREKAAAIVAKGAGVAPTEPTKPGNGGFVGTDPGPISPADWAPCQKPACAFDGAIDTEPSTLTGMECNGCARLEMRDEWQTGTRRRYWWRCAKGHELLEVRRYGERVTVAPPECDDFEQWQPGTK